MCKMCKMCEMCKISKMSKVCKISKTYWKCKMCKMCKMFKMCKILNWVKCVKCVRCVKCVKCVKGVKCIRCEKDKERPPWQLLCCCCGRLLSNSPAWPWPFQAPKVLVRYKLQSNYSYRDNCEHFLASVTNKKVVLKPNPIFRREKVWSHRGHASRGPPRAVW